MQLGFLWIGMYITYYTNAYFILCLWSFLCSEEDMITVKAALYLLEVVVKHAASNKNFFVTAIKLFLTSASRVESRFQEVKDNATKKLTDIAKQATVKICRLSVFNVQLAEQKKHEIQVYMQVIHY